MKTLQHSMLAWNTIWLQSSIAHYYMKILLQSTEEAQKVTMKSYEASQPTTTKVTMTADSKRFRATSSSTCACVAHSRTASRNGTRKPLTSSNTEVRIRGPNQIRFLSDWVSVTRLGKILPVWPFLKSLASLRTLQ